MSLDSFLMRENRPWGNFRVYILNTPVGMRWAPRFREDLAKAYPEAQDMNRLQGFFGATLRGDFAPATVKIISVNPASRLSLQYHRHRSETWFCLKGDAKATIGPDLKRYPFGVGETVTIPVGAYHRLESEKGADVLEVARGEFDESDIVRVEDDYARAAPRIG